MFAITIIINSIFLFQSVPSATTGVFQSSLHRGRLFSSRISVPGFKPRVIIIKPFQGFLSFPSATTGVFQSSLHRGRGFEFASLPGVAFVPLLPRATNMPHLRRFCHYFKFELTFSISSNFPQRTFLSVRNKESFSIIVTSRTVVFQSHFCPGVKNHGLLKLNPFRVFFPFRLQQREFFNHRYIADGVF